MGYLFLALAVLCGGIKGYCGKFTGNIMNGFKDAALANTLRMVLCVAIGLIIVLATGASFAVSTATALICILSGIATSVFVVSWLVIVKRGAYMMIDVFLMLGTLVPIVFGKILFNENIGINQTVGISIIFVAVLIMCSYNNSIKQKLDVRSFLLLMLCGTANGFADLSQKLLVKTTAEMPVSTFNLYTYFVSAIVLFLFYVLTKGDAEQSSFKKVKKASPYIVIMSVCLFAYSFLKTIAARYLDSSVLYPLAQGSGLVLSTFMSAVFFKERLTKKCVTGVCIAILGMVVLNLF